MNTSLRYKFRSALVRLLPRLGDEVSHDEKDNVGNKRGGNINNALFDTLLEKANDAKANKRAHN